MLRNTIGLMAEFVDRTGTSTRDSLVTGGKNPLQTELAMQRVEGQKGDRCGAIRIGEDTLVILDIGPVDFGNDERHVGVHAKGGGIIHNDSPVTDGLRRKIAGYRTARAEDRNIDILKRIHIKWLDRVRFPPEGERLAGGTRRGQEAKAGHRKVTAFHDTKHFGSDSSRRTNDCDSIGFRHSICVYD